MIENGTTSETDRGPADRETAGPDKARTKPASIKGLFRTAAKALTGNDDKPKPETQRRRRGETEGELRKYVPPADHGQPAARGRFAGLQGKISAAAKIGRTFTRAAAAATEVYAEASIHQSDTLDCMNPFEPPDAFAADIDADLGGPQDRYFPQL